MQHSNIDRFYFALELLLLVDSFINWSAGSIINPLSQSNNCRLLNVRICCFSLLFLTVNEESLDLRLLVGQKRQF